MRRGGKTGCEHAEVYRTETGSLIRYNSLVFAFLALRHFVVPLYVSVLCDVTMAVTSVLAFNKKITDTLYNVTDRHSCYIRLGIDVTSYFGVILLGRTIRNSTFVSSCAGKI